MTAAIEVLGVDKSFQRGTRVLKDVRLSIATGEMVALIGASGSGKSTLIRAIAGLVNVDNPTRREDAKSAGRIRILNETMQEGGRVCGAASKLRARIGIVFQQFNLVPRLSVLTNVCLGFLGQVSGWRGSLARFSLGEQRRAMQALDRVGIAEHALKRGSELSGGQ